MNNIEKKRIVRYFIISKMLHLRYNDTTKQKRRRDTRMRELFVETRTAVGEDGRLHSFDYYVVIGLGPGRGGRLALIREYIGRCAKRTSGTKGGGGGADGRSAPFL